MYDVTIIGAGPAGMIAAITAARAGRNVCLIEHNDKPGKKILVTGNGKCNITNMDMAPSYYRSNSKESYFSVIESFGPNELRIFLMEIGLITKEKNGYVYPFSEQASSVLDVLRNEISRLRINLMTEVNVTGISPSFIITTDHGIIESYSLILACGSKCAPKTGSDGSGYELAKSLGHNIITPIPALVQIKCKENFFREMSGVRVNATVTLTVDGIKKDGDTGELQITDYGISGIPVFQISRCIKREIDKKSNPLVHINFMPGYKDKDVRKILVNLFSCNPKIDYISALNGLFNRKLASVILKSSGVDKGRPCREYTDEVINKICRNILDFVVTPTDTNGFENAQVCAGGVDLDEIDLTTMESRIVKNLYFAGEILDVDGKCGGYNLQWAFSSGKLAGLSAEGIKND